MNIRPKIILVVLPLIITSAALAASAAYFAAAHGVSRAAERLLSFKARELQHYAENQWALLLENNFAHRPDMIAAAQYAVQRYAQSLLLSPTERILALDRSGALAMSSGELPLAPEEAQRLLPLLDDAGDALFDATLGGRLRVVRAFFFPPFQWWVLLTEERALFYQEAEKAAAQTLILIAASSTLAAALLLLFARLITRPLGKVAAAMGRIIASSDLSARVEVEYQDEAGRLASTFNLMIGELEKAQGQIKRYAFDAVLAQKKEQRIRRIFQKYVPKDLIDRFFASPQSMLVGDNRVVAVLFSDIRSFTTISEGLAPEELVNALNRYFSGQVDIIMNRNGIVDKYIGDAIMAVWGAPVQHDDDALQSVLAALDMLDALGNFNALQRRLEKQEFHIGIGVSYGPVTAGNIGSERKMDYTVIGDMVNLASRLEGLTKVYRQELLISETVYGEVRTALPCRFLDTVAVKGKARGVKIYTAKRALSEPEKQAWALHHEGMGCYYRRRFREAAVKFQEVLTLLPRDYCAALLLRRALSYANTPPPEAWDGVEVMRSK